MTECWLYIYENSEQRTLYIGIANKMDRVYGAHNDAATRLRDSPGTVILQTVTPFSSREDARRAEAVAIYVASFAGFAVFQDQGNQTPLKVTNKSGTCSTEELGPAIFTKPGEVSIDDLEQVVVVTIDGSEIDDRPSPFGGRRGAVFSTRAAGYWKVGHHMRPKVRHLIALLKGSRGVILGSWEIDPNGEWALPAGKECKAPRVVIPLLEIDEDDFLGIKGQRLVGVSGQPGVVYSPDLSC